MPSNRTAAVRFGIGNHAGNRERLYKYEKEDGAQGQNRTADTGIFNPLLYRLSYLGSKRSANYKQVTEMSQAEVVFNTISA